MFSIIGFCCCILFRRCVFSIGGFRLLIGVFILLLGYLSLGSYLVYNLTLSANYYCQNKKCADGNGNQDRSEGNNLMFVGDNFPLNDAYYQYGSLQYLKMAQNKCDCKDHPQHHTLPKNKKVQHIINLIRNNFISPYKIMYMLDPKQADYFKSRNQSSGCCSSNHITISNQRCTKTQRHLKDLISYSSLVSDLNIFLEVCLQRFNKIVESGRKDNLEVTNDVQKFLLDKVMAESINNHLFIKLTKLIKEESTNNNKQIGLWATPTTWYQKYPQQKLDYLQGKFISQLISKKWAVAHHYAGNQQQLLRELSILEKDGKFEQSKWIPNTKVLNNIEKYLLIRTSNDKFLFQETRELIVKLSSIPFQLNAKANMFCTVSPNLHVLYSKNKLKSNPSQGDLKYTMFINIGANVMIILDKSQILLPKQSMILFNSEMEYAICSEGPLFLLINFIGCVQRK